MIVWVLLSFINTTGVASLGQFESEAACREFRQTVRSNNPWYKNEHVESKSLICVQAKVAK